MKMSPFTALITVAVAAFMTASFQTAHVRAEAPQGQSPDEALPDAPGKAVVGRVCTTCHGIDYLVPSERMVPVWRDTLDLMKGYGAEASDEEWRTITAYIMANLAYLSVNKAMAEDVAVVFGVTEETAKSVIAYRDKQGGFKTIDDLKKAPGLDAAKVDALKQRLMFESNQ